MWITCGLLVTLVQLICRCDRGESVYVDVKYQSVFVGRLSHTLPLFPREWFRFRIHIWTWCQMPTWHYKWGKIAFLIVILVCRCQFTYASPHAIQCPNRLALISCKIIPLCCFLFSFKWCVCLPVYFIWEYIHIFERWHKTVFHITSSPPFFRL